VTVICAVHELHTEGRTIQPKLDQINPAKSATSALVIQYRSDINNNVR